MLNDKYDNNFHSVCNDLNQVAKHILSDCLDLVFYFAIDESNRLSRICEFSSISDVYSDYSEVSSIVQEFSMTISESRKNRGILRITAYIDMVSSEKYKKLIAYCLSISEIEKNLKIRRKNEIKETRRWALGIIIPAIIGLSVAFFTGYYFSPPP